MEQRDQIIIGVVVTQGLGVLVMHQISDSMVTAVRLSGLANHGRWLLRSPGEVIGRIG